MTLANLRHRLECSICSSAMRLSARPCAFPWITTYRRTLDLVPHRYVFPIVISGVFPTVFVVIGHALVHQVLHLFQRAGGLRLLQPEQTNEFMAAGVVYFIKLVARAEFGPDRVP